MIKVIIGKKEMFIKGDNNQWAVGKMVQSTNRETGEVTQSFIGDSFYSSIDGMIKGVLEHKLRCSDSNSLTELQDALRRAKDELRGLYDTSSI